MSSPTTSSIFVGEGFATPSSEQAAAVEAWFPSITQYADEAQAKAKHPELAKLDLGDFAWSSYPSATPTSRRPIICWINVDQEPKNPADIYLRLHLLSNRTFKPHQINLNGIFGKLVNLAWTSHGPVELDQLTKKRQEVGQQGEWLRVFSVDKFPAMADYVMPKGVRIANAANIRLGAYLGEGTTVMHAGFVNFNAGTLGESMVEGRVSAGVTLGAGTDLGGGASTMGTLSGGNDVVISLGKNCLIGANAGTGIPLGDGCTIEAGCYITAGMRITDLRADPTNGPTIKAKDLAFADHLLLRRNSATGQIECLKNLKTIELNATLHQDQ